MSVTVTVAELTDKTLALSEAYKSGESSVGYKYAYITGDNTTKVYKDGHTLPSSKVASKVYTVSMAAAAQQGMTKEQVVNAIKTAGVKLTVTVATATASQISDSRVAVWASSSAQVDGNTAGYTISAGSLANVENRHIANPLTLTSWTGDAAVVGWFTVQVDGNKADSDSQSQDEYTALPTITATIAKA